MTISKKRPVKITKKMFDDNSDDITMFDSDEKPIDVLKPASKDEGNSYYPSNARLYDKFKTMITTEVNKSIVSNIKELTVTDMKVARALAEGLSDIEIIEIFNTDYQSLDLLQMNPHFVTEVQRLTAITGYGDKTKRVQGLARLLGMLHNDLISNPEQIAFMQTKDKIKLASEISSQLDKAQNIGIETTSRKDITLIIKERNIDEKRIIKDMEGNVRIKSQFPTLNNATGQIENDPNNEYKGIKKL